MIRTSTDWLPLRPTGRTSPVASTRSSRSWVSAGRARDFVEQQGSAIGLDELADLGGECAREGALLVTEQLAVDDVGGDRLAVERQQRPLGAKAGGVDRAGDGFLAGAGFADDQDRQAVARGFGRDCKRGAEFGRGADQLLERQRRARAFRTPEQVRRRPCGGRHWRQALRAAAPARPAERENRTRRRASPRRRSATLSPCDRTMTGSFARFSRSAAISSGPRCSSQLPSSAARTSRPCGPWRMAIALSSSAAPMTLQPARAAMAEISRRSSASVSSSNSERVGSSRISALGAAYAGRGKCRLKSAAVDRTWASAARLVMDAATNAKREISWPKRSRCWSARPLRTSRCTSATTTRFTKLLKWGAMICFIIGFIVL